MVGQADRTFRVVQATAHCEAHWSPAAALNVGAAEMVTASASDEYNHLDFWEEDVKSEHSIDSLVGKCSQECIFWFRCTWSSAYPADNIAIVLYHLPTVHTTHIS